ncbi:hypothetical protein C8Q79DRAFT_915652 [Trametes meyenii]|nr:hypothetical protein C8Q79DRAFT_915652 [Trametes meyenii]
MLKTNPNVFDKPLYRADRSRSVTEILVTASGTINTTVNEPSVFHWQLYLIPRAPESSTHLVSGNPLEGSSPTNSSSGSQSVLIDMIPANPPTGVMYLASRESRGLHADPKIELPIQVALSPQAPTVQQIVDLFLEKGMGRYKFDESGSGCLHWLMTGVRHLEDAGLVERGASENLRVFHREQVELHPERHPMPIRRGVFWCVTYESCTNRTALR